MQHLFRWRLNLSPVFFLSVHIICGSRISPLCCPGSLGGWVWAVRAAAAEVWSQQSSLVDQCARLDNYSHSEVCVEACGSDRDTCQLSCVILTLYFSLFQMRKILTHGSSFILRYLNFLQKSNNYVFVRLGYVRILFWRGRFMICLILERKVFDFYLPRGSVLCFVFDLFICLHFFFLFLWSSNMWGLKFRLLEIIIFVNLALKSSPYNGDYLN